MEYSNFLVAVLSVLVTALLGLQIFNILSFEKRLKSAKREIIKSIKPDIEKGKYEAIGTALYNLAGAMFDSNMLNHSITCYIKAANCIYKENADKVEIDMCFDKLDKIINIIEEKNQTLLIGPETKDGYLNMLYEIKGKRNEKIIKFLLNHSK